MNECMCGSCLKLVPKIKAEIRKRGRGHVYRDTEGAPWHGNTCPACHRKDANTRYGRYFRSGTSAVKVKNERLCRKCGKRLSGDRYFYHAHCSVLMVEAYGEQEYGGFCARGEGF